MRLGRLLLPLLFAISGSGCAASPPAAPTPFSKRDEDVVITLVQREFMYRRGASRVLLADLTIPECRAEGRSQVDIDCFVTPNQRMYLQTHRPWSLNLPHLFRNLKRRKVRL